MVIKVVIGTKKGRSLQKELSEEETGFLQGKKIGDKISGDDIGFAGYEFEIAGGSDHCGFPMRKDVDGASRKKILAVEAVGLKKKAKGIRQRKTICGNTVGMNTSQVNLRILKEGAQPLIEEKPAEEPKSEEKKEEPKAPKEEKKEEPAEKKEAPKAEEAPKEAPKAEAPAEEKKE
ncbi:30S ribosomal protein S6e [Candidatus Woesearchaeota archaeon]|nr:30S ribosomal protein S6e [Candidatus Woesearchaeota archaeon]